MFEYATAVGLAEKANLQVLLPSDSPLLKVFNLSATIISSEVYEFLISANVRFAIHEHVS